MYVCMYVCIYLSISLSIYLSICPSIYLSIYLSISLYIYIYTDYTEKGSVRKAKYFYSINVFLKLFLCNTSLNGFKIYISTDFGRLQQSMELILYDSEKRLVQLLLAEMHKVVEKSQI